MKDLDPYADSFDWTSPKVNVLVARWPELCDMVASAIVPALDRLIADPAGYPAEFGEEATTEDEAVARWNDVLVKIRAGFHAHTQLHECLLHGEAINRAAKEREEGLALFAQYFPHLWS